MPSGIAGLISLCDYLDGQEAAMEAVNLADAKARLRAFVDRVQVGEPVEITRRGRPVARLVAVAGLRKRVDASRPGALTATMPGQAVGAAELVRAMRDGDRSRCSK